MTERAGSETEAKCWRLLVVVAERWSSAEADIVHLLAAEISFDIDVVAVNCPVDAQPVSLLEGLYRMLDRRVFGGAATILTRPGLLPLKKADVTALVRDRQPDAIVDLTGTLTSRVLPADIPLIHLYFEGRSAAHLGNAVRHRLGAPHGTVWVQTVAEGLNAKRMLFSAACFVDHRSLVRSVELVTRKVPMILQAGLRRWAQAPRLEGGDLNIAALPSTPALRSMQLLWRLAVSIGRRLLWRDQWKILVYRDQTRERLSDVWLFPTPNSDAGAFWADPFVVSHARGTTIFFEEVPFATGKGRISLIDIDHEGRAGNPVVVLDKAWHLSYPFVFEWNGRRYMIPESSANETLDLYECISFPEQWCHVKTLIDGCRLADATVVDWHGRLWMFAAHAQRGASIYDELHIFWADDLLGPWHAHDLNPVKIDAGSARPAGAMFVEDGRLIRPTQDCRNRYGDSVAFQDILVLDEQHFEERTLDRMKPIGAKPDEAFHTYNASGRIVAIDVAGSVWRLGGAA